MPRPDQRASDTAVETFDEFVTDLQSLRRHAGNVPYSEIAARIGRRREELGAAPGSARIARSSVYDTFRTGRSRINPRLVVEIVQALGVDDAEAESWRLRSLAARGATTQPLPAPPPAPAPAPMLDPVATATRAFAIVLVAACIGINHLGGTLALALHLPLFLDMIGTAIAAFVLGPRWAILAGVALNIAGGITAGPGTMWFALVNVTGALLWAYGIRSRRFGGTPARFLLLNVLVAVACSIVATPINVMVFGGGSGNPTDGFLGVLTHSGFGLWSAVFAVNVSVSIVDKLFAGYLALGATLLLRRWGVASDLLLAPRLIPPGNL